MKNNEDKFWNIIDDIGWGTKTTDYRNVFEYLLKTYTIDDIIKLRLFCIEKRKSMQTWLRNSSSGVYWGDDRFWDLGAHIVGLGKEQYYAIKEDINIAIDMCDNFRYTENFEYSFSLNRIRECIKIKCEIEKI